MQGGVSFGITQLMPRGAITLKDGHVEQRNTPPYIKDVPIAVDVHIVPSSEKPSGCGEPPRRPLSMRYPGLQVGDIGDFL
jgi:isoquinoline 1-oxidoreductase subunit beta